VRHVRILGLCLVSVLAVAAIGAVPALAKTETIQGEFDKLFSACPVGTEGLSACDYGEAGKESFFQAGKATVKFQKPVILRGGLIENEETGALTWVGSRYGDTISKEAEPAPSLTEGINPELLPEPEKKRYEEYLAAGKSTKVTATVELAKPATGNIQVSLSSLLSESGTAFAFPVMIHLRNKFLGEHCYVGSTQEPIEIQFTTGETSPPLPNTPIHGALGTISVTAEGRTLRIHGTQLVNNSYAAPGVQGCGMARTTEAGNVWGADAAIDAGLGLPSPAGSNTTELIGQLAQTGAESAREFLHFGE
jgi:hypothetical protein